MKSLLKSYTFEPKVYGAYTKVKEKRQSHNHYNHELTPPPFGSLFHFIESLSLEI